MITRQIDRVVSGGAEQGPGRQRSRAAVASHIGHRSTMWKAGTLVGSSAPVGQAFEVDAAGRRLLGGISAQDLLRPLIRRQNRRWRWAVVGSSSRGGQGWSPASTVFRSTTG